MSTDNPTPDDETSDFVGGSGSKLDGLTEFVGLKPATPGEDILIGVKLGDVTIVRLIAEGGMGRVYEGVQVRPNRTVAVKVMRPGLANQTLLKRFEYEAELLGRLQHPGIGQIYSAGVHSLAGVSVPYFVMEYITDAKTLTAYAEERRLPTQDRLTLFRQVCDAVTHGHQKGVIHRDLKPSNILVDSSGQPKVIDFGIAKATEADIALTTIQTDVGHLVGTFQYMSPEQFDANPNNIDIRTDVYALGVVLYELLTGQPPYDVRKKAVYEAMRIVKEEDPTPIAHLNKTLRREVAVIAATCLEKDKSRRYSSASELAGDVSRYLAGEPIHAASPSFWDGVRRLARKHRAAASAVTGVAIALLIAIAGISAFAFRADQERVKANLARDEAVRLEAAAVRERDNAKNAADFVLDVLRSTSRYSTDRALSVSDMLVRAARAIPERFRDAPDVQGDLLQVIAILLHEGDQLHRHESQALMEQAVALWEERVSEGEVHREDRLAGALAGLGSVHLWNNRLLDAAPLFERAAAIAERLYASDSPQLARFKGGLAQIAKARGDTAEAESLYRQQLAIYESSYGRQHELTAASINELGVLARLQGNLSEAEEMLRETLDIMRSLYGDTHARIAITTMHLGHVLRLQSRLSEARQCFEVALNIALVTLGRESEKTAGAFAGLGDLDLAEGHYESAVARYEEALAITLRTSGESDPRLGEWRASLATARQAQEHSHD